MMATRDATSKQKKVNMLSTKKTFKRNINDGRHRLLPDTNHPKVDKITKFSSNIDTRPTSSITRNSIQNSPPAQNFSSRNSLRTAKTFSTHPQITFVPFTMPNIADFNWTEPIGFENIVDDTHNYHILSSDLFLKLENDTLVCMLCGRKEKLFRGTVEFHQESELHNRRYDDLRLYLIQEAPDDSSLQMNALSELLNIWYMQQSLTDEMIKSRIFVIQEFNVILNLVMPDCHNRVIGSMMTGTTLKSSDINLELIHPNSDIFESDPRSKHSIHHKLIDPDAELGEQINNHLVYYDLIPNAIDTLYKVMNAIENRYQGSPTSSFSVVSKLNDLNAKVPKLVLRHEPSKIQVNICCYAESSHKLAVLLRTYMTLDPRAPILSVLVKYWAKICKIDDPDNGTYPPDVFIILVIYYLQRTSPPILPCLHELVNKNSKTDTRQNLSETDAINQFSKLNIKDDDHQKKNANASIDERQEVNGSKAKENNLDNPLEAMEDGNEEEVDDEEEDADYLTVDNDIIKNIDWNSSNQTSVHKLFLNFLRFMSQEFNDQRNVISIRSSRDVPLKSKRYVTQVKAIEHPVRPKINMSRCVGTARTFQYISQCFKQGYQYLTCLPVNSSFQPKVKKEGHFDPSDYTDLYINTRRFESYFRMRKDSIQSKCRYNPLDEMIRQNLFAKDIEVIKGLFERSQNRTILPGVVAKFYTDQCLVPKDSMATVFCWSCKGIGHTRETCFRAKIESLAEECESYDIELDVDANLDSYFINLYSQDIITPQLSMAHEDIVDRLEVIINTGTGLNCKLQLFGSTVNDLGSSDSDLDICLTLDGNPTGKGVDYVTVLAKVHSVLIKEDEIDSVEAILSARVPIIKFKYSSRDVDLSMYNQCAIYNSKLLKAYAKIDQRVAQLFYLVKRYAKACKIADASRGSLSSYAWSLMVIHYLQQTQPATLPVLQEVPHGSTKHLIGINGWNVWFNDQHTCVPTPENEMTLTQLFKGFFLYYSNFDFNYYVVSIRKAHRITRFQKNWNNCFMAIEDPFELTYNLASRLDEPMAIYIIKNIVAVQLACRDQRRQKMDFKKIHLQRIFDGRYITNSNPPYRGCRVCHRIGHRFKDCPEKNANRNQNNTRPRTRTT